MSPWLEQAVQDWMPTLDKKKLNLENLQEHLTKVASGLKVATCQMGLQNLDLYLSGRKQLGGNLIATFK